MVCDDDAVYCSFSETNPVCEIGCREGGSETHLNMLYNVDVDDLFHRDLYQLFLEDYSLYRNLHRE